MRHMFWVFWVFFLCVTCFVVRWQDEHDESARAFDAVAIFSSSPLSLQLITVLFVGLQVLCRRSVHFSFLLDYVYSLYECGWANASISGSIVKRFCCGLAYSHTCDGGMQKEPEKIDCDENIVLWRWHFPCRRWAILLSITRSSRCGAVHRASHRLQSHRL